MAEITYAGGRPITPMQTLIDSYETESESGIVSHRILDGPPVYTLRGAEPEHGTLHLVFADEISALDARAAHRLPAVFTIADPARNLLNFRYITRDRVRVHLDPETKRRWVLQVPFEVVP